jgi:hypothetical protein
MKNNNEKDRWAKLAGLPKKETKQQLDENVVGIGSVNQIFPHREPTGYEMAFEHFLGGKYGSNKYINEGVELSKLMQGDNLNTQIRLAPNMSYSNLKNLEEYTFTPVEIETDDYGDQRLVLKTKNGELKSYSISDGVVEDILTYDELKQKGNLQEKTNEGGDIEENIYDDYNMKSYKDQKAGRTHRVDMSDFEEKEKERGRKAREKGKEWEKNSSKDINEGGDIEENINLADDSEMVSRIEGLANVRDLKTMKDMLRILTTEWEQEGFDREDIQDYITDFINKI